MSQFILNPVVRLAICLASAVGNWYAFVWIGEKFGVKDPIFVASALLASLFIHELAHAISMRRNGIPSLIFFIVILGGAMPLDIDAFDKLRDGKKAEIYLAGMFGNLAVGCAAIFLGVGKYLTPTQVDQVLNMNAGLILFNLIPIAGFDGSRFVRVLFHNISPEWDSVLFQITAIPVAIAMMALLYLRGDVVIAVPLILLQLYMRSRRHDTSIRGTMHRDEQIYWAVMFAGLVVLALVVFTHTGTWNR